MRSVAYDHFYAYDELTDTLRTWSEEAPNLCVLESIGQSYEGRDIWLATVTNSETTCVPVLKVGPCCASVAIEAITAIVVAASSPW